MKLSSCCYAEPISNGDYSTEDYAICPVCHDHCEYVEVKEED